ncbi:unnamed protein product [Moneuplotes crassus]|uniref:TRAF-type domain-containing protein n=1 Tax=Euplotes crassus TaxID=5936 RepID=A0AAD1UJ06_EUPCR|nr:unnamed protein product [Moneuplotes crassus]
MAGFEVERFLNPPQELMEYLCGICMKILYKPTQCKRCATYYCFDCIKRKLCPNDCQKGKEDSSLYTINKYMKNKINKTLTIKCKYEEYGCNESFLLKDILSHEKSCPSQAFFCPNKGCYQRIPAFKLEPHLKMCDYQIVPCNSCGFEILRKEQGNHDCVTRMLQHIDKMNEKNQEMSDRIKDLHSQENELKNRLDYMTTENNNETMKLNQQVEHTTRENDTLMHDLSSIPSGPLEKTRQEELEELNEFDNVNEKTVSRYIKKVDNRIHDHCDEISEAFIALQERLRDHFRIFSDSIQDKFEREVIHNGINQEFEKLSPIKNKYDDEEDYEDTGAESRLSGIDESEEKPRNDECLTPELSHMKNTLVRAYTNPLEEYHSTINTTAEFGKNVRLQKELQYMSTKQRNQRDERSTSVDQKIKRENMNHRLGLSKMRQSLGSNNQSPLKAVKSSRLWNAFDSNDPYPDKKFTTNMNGSVTPQSVTPTNKRRRKSLNKTKSSTMVGEKKVRRKKDELVKTLLFSNRNR